MRVSDADAWALARAVAGLPTDGAVVSPMCALLLRRLGTQKPGVEDVEQLRQWFGQELLAQVFAVDPKEEAPETDSGTAPPSLPKAARVDVRKHPRVGAWLDEWMRWATTRAAMTDPIFLESGGLWLISLATARRAVLPLDFADVYNPLYVLWCAPTTYHRKSTGLRAIHTLAATTFPELLLPGQSTPEMLLHRLAGGLPVNFEKLPLGFQAQERNGQRFAGQRGVISDEVTKLFDKDYMRGLIEFLLELYDCPDVLDKEFRQYGRIVVRQAGVSMLAATTPARLGRLFGDLEWEDGLLARFALLTPTREYVERTPTRRAEPPSGALGTVQIMLRRLFEKLPSPPTIDMEAGDFGEMPAQAARISDEALEMFNTYGEALHQMCAPRSGLDERLAGAYGRLPVMGLKVALNLALMDWAMATESEIMIGAGHWARAQEIVEQWRASAHRLLAELTRSMDQRVEDRLLEAIRTARQPVTKHDWYRRARVASRRDAYSAIDALFEAGKVSKIAMPSGTGEGYLLR